MRIERQDRQPEPRTDEIEKNWRDWARGNEYIQKKSIMVEAGVLGVSLELWESSFGGLIYLPPIPRTKGADVLYIADNLNEMLETVKMLVVGALAMVQVKQEQREERARLN